MSHPPAAAETDFQPAQVQFTSVTTQLPFSQPHNSRQSSNLMISTWRIPPRTTSAAMKTRIDHRTTVLQLVLIVALKPRQIDGRD
jgi:hypothetical protein